MNILLYAGSWTQNIGNAFFDLGAKYILSQAVPDASIYMSGGIGRWLFYNPILKKMPKEKNFLFRKNKANTNIDVMNALEMASLSDVDLVVFAGMCMTEEFVLINGPTFDAIRNNRIPVLIMGGGGAFYNDREASIFSDFLRKIGNVGVISRDSCVYELFYKRIPNLEYGIDCAFFASEYCPAYPLLATSYIVEVFDDCGDYPKLEHNNKTVFRAHHNTWGALPLEYFQEGNTLLSDIPDDYLTLYSGADIVYSNRVHACVAALSYGKQARLYSNTKRAHLFDEVAAPNITKEIVSLDLSLFGEKKQRMVESVRAMIQRIAR